MKKLLAVFGVLCVLGILGVGVLGVFRVIHEIYLHFLYPWYGHSFTRARENMQKFSGKSS